MQIDPQIKSQVTWTTSDVYITHSAEYNVWSYSLDKLPGFDSQAQKY